MDFKPMNTNSKNTNKILVDFEVMFDYDLATVYYLITHCKNMDILNPAIGVATTESAIKNMMLFRSDNNPLEVCIKEEYKDSINGLYKDLIDKHEKDILDIITPNDLFSYFTILSMTDNLVDITVNCKTELQKKFCEDKISSLKSIINERDLDNYDTLYIKYSTDIIQYKNIVKKKIYIINGMYNFDTGIFKKCILLIADQNIVNTIDPYRNITIPAIYNIV